MSNLNFRWKKLWPIGDAATTLSCVFCPWFKTRLSMYLQLLPNTISKYKSYLNRKKLDASFCCWVAARVPDMFCNFYLAKCSKIGNNLAIKEAREKNTNLESLE